MAKTPNKPTRPTRPIRSPAEVRSRAPAHRTAARRKGPASPGEDMRKSDATRQRILDSAAVVMARAGFAGTKLSDIAQQADLKIATLYYYFESREDLMLAVILTGIDHVRDHTEAAVAAVPATASPLDRLCVAVEAHLRFILEISHYTEAAVRNSGQLPEHMRSEIDRKLAGFGRFWEQLVDAAATGTQFRTPGQRRALRMLIIGGLNWTVEWWTPSRAPLAEVVSTALAITRSALGRPA